MKRFAPFFCLLCYASFSLGAQTQTFQFSFQKEPINKEPTKQPEISVKPQNNQITPSNVPSKPTNPIPYAIPLNTPLVKPANPDTNSNINKIPEVPSKPVNPVPYAIPLNTPLTTKSLEMPTKPDVNSNIKTPDITSNPLKTIPLTKTPTKPIESTPNQLNNKINSNTEITKFPTNNISQSTPRLSLQMSVNEMNVKRLLQIAKTENLNDKAAQKAIHDIEQTKQSPYMNIHARQLNEQGLKLLREHKIEEAFKVFEKALLLDPLDTEANYNFSSTHLKLVNDHTTEALLLKTLALSPKRTAAWVNLAEFYNQQSRAKDFYASMMLAFYFSNDAEQTKNTFKKLFQKTVPNSPQYILYEKGLSQPTVQQMLVQTTSSEQSTEQNIENILINVLKIDQKTNDRIENTQLAIQAYIEKGIINNKPNKRVDYVDYYLVNKSTNFMGHTLILIEEEYMLKYIGCCVNSGIGIVVRLMGNSNNLEEFATQNNCQFENNFNLREKLTQLNLTTHLLEGQFAFLSCRENKL